MGNSRIQRSPPQMAESVALGPRRGSTSWGKGPVEETCSAHGNVRKPGSRREPPSRAHLQGNPSAAPHLPSSHQVPPFKLRWPNGAAALII